MNRQGQPQQRPPTMGPTPGLANQFRPPYPFGLPPRNVNMLQTGGYVPSLQPNSQRGPSQTPSNIVPSSASPFLQQQQRGQSTFPFGGGALGGQQPSIPSQQQSQTQQPNGTGPPPSVSSASEVGLDPNDFPALGSTSASNNQSSNANGSLGGGSYASQAGGLGSAGVVGGPSLGSAGGANQPRDFTPDDFPALGGQSTQPQSQQQSQQSQSNSQDAHLHPPGLNGFQHSSDQQQQRQNILGALSGGITSNTQATPGMLNLTAAQARGVLPAFPGGLDAEKQQQRNNYALKLNQSAQQAWNAASTPSSQPASALAGAFANPPSTQQNGTLPNNAASHLGAPPGVPPPPAGAFGQQGSSNPPTGKANYGSNGVDVGNSANLPPNPNSTTNSTTISNTHPQTPAQQVLMSAADRWGLLGLLAMIRSTSTDMDHGLSSVGTDLGTMGLDMGYPGNLYSTFITPWADQSAAHSVEPDFELPQCYNLTAAPPGPSKAAAFSDETLFFMFYSSPRDALQEVAAQELYNRNWRYHKDLRLWITKESGTAPTQKIPGGELGSYTYWDTENWTRERKEMTVMYSDLEEKSVPVFAQGPTLVLATSQQPQAQQGQQQLGQQQHQQASQQQPIQPRPYQVGAL